MESFHLPETVQVFSNSTSISQSNINPLQNRNKPAFAQSAINTPHALNVATSVGHRGCPKTPRVTTGILELTFHPHFLV